jgi:hypothetical protein
MKTWRILQTKLESVGKGFNSALESFSGYVAAGFLLSRNGFWFTVGFPSIVCNSYGRIVG